MKTHKILFSKKANENSTTPMYPSAEYIEGMVDLNATGTFCLSSDDDRLVTDKLYEVRERSLPDWLSPQEWIADLVNWKYTWGAGVSQDWSEAWQRGLKSLPFDERFVCAKLLKTKKFRSSFRESLANQLKNWLDSPERRKYNMPFSDKQWESLFDRHTIIECKRLSEGLYRNRNY